MSIPNTGSVNVASLLEEEWIKHCPLKSFQKMLWNQGQSKLMPFTSVKGLVFKISILWSRTIMELFNLVFQLYINNKSKPCLETHVMSIKLCYTNITPVTCSHSTLWSIFSCMFLNSSVNLHHYHYLEQIKQQTRTHWSFSLRKAFYYELTTTQHRLKLSSGCFALQIFAWLEFPLMAGTWWLPACKKR